MNAPAVPNAAPDDGSDTPPLLSIDDGCATIRLNRPSHHNRIDPDDVGVLRAHLARVRADASVRVLVITGSGVKTFSSGYTLQAILERLHERALEQLLDELEQYPLPTIAAINGGIYGGATDLALCCDLRIGVPHARMFMPAARFGLHYYPGGIRRYLSRLGHTAATKLFLTATTIDAAEMLRIGFLTDLVAPDALDATVGRYVGELQQCEPNAIADMKRSLYEMVSVFPPPPSLDRRYLQSLASPELQQRLDRLLR
ncbi:MAG TPA: enoyl-CoA hydratase/isomerase family protein [Burkholderiaceae bacterium]|nr:enoyl-CoA hydratase/isomerase family protein [Burkholderiaceae bacterium]